MLKVVFADDEAPARRKMRTLLDREADVVVVGEAADGEEAVALIREHVPDVALLDIQMPRLDGFDVVREVGPGTVPFVVFVTAYDEHALRAFEAQALDYLLKPLAPTRLAEVMARIRRQRAAAPLAGAEARFEQLLAVLRPAPQYLKHVLADRGDDRQVAVPVETIDRIAADRNYLRIFAGGVEYLRRAVLSEFEQRLDPDQFLRINRSDIVRIGAVAEFQPWFHGDARVRMRDGTVLTWSRRYRSKSPFGF